MDAPYTFSPSAVETWLSCKRKWAWSKIAKVPKVDADSAMLGGEVHAQLEGYLAGQPFDFTHPKGAGYIAAAGVHLIPEPNAPGMAIEKEFRFTSPRTGYVWNGRKDLDVDDSIIIPGLEGGAPAVLDHKSTSNLRWKKTPDDLLWDVQANVYAHASMSERNAPAVDLVWVYYQTRGAKKAERTHLRMYRDHAERAFNIIEDIAMGMAGALRMAEDEADKHAFVQSLPATPSHCEAYGGCPFRHLCQLSPEQSRPSLMNSTIDTNFVDSLKARAEQQDGVMGMAAEAVPAPTALPDWLSSPSPTVSAAPAAYFAPMPTAIMSNIAPINPPEGLPFPAVDIRTLPGTIDLIMVEASIPAAETKPKGRPRGSKNKPKDPEGADVMAHTEAVAKPVDAYEAVIAKVIAEGIEDLNTLLGPPSKAFAEGESAATDQHIYMTYDARTNEPEPEPIADGSFTLYLDCAPVGLYTPVESFLSEAKAIIRNAFKDAEGLPIQDYRFLPYGQGAGALAAATVAAVQANPPKHLVVSTRTPEGAIVASDLASLATFVVRGL